MRSWNTAILPSRCRTPSRSRLVRRFFVSSLVLPAVAPVQSLSSRQHQYQQQQQQQQQQGSTRYFHLPRSSAANTATNQARARQVRLSLASSSTTTFQPPDPPGTNGTPVFSDIDFATASDSSCESIQRNQDSDAIFVVTGASRGIGLELVKQLVSRTKGTVVACCRQPERATELKKFISALEETDDNSEMQRVRPIPLDVADQYSIETVGKQIKDQFGRVDMLWNVAGILGDAGKTTPGPERSLSKLDRNWMDQTLAVNLVGPIMLTKELAPLMMQRRPSRRSGSSSSSSSSSNSDKSKRAAAVVVNLSARVGSISDNGLGGWYSYRISKSGLNQATRTVAHEFTKRHAIWAIALHPGTTDTDLSLPFQGNVKEGSLFPVSFTVAQLLKIVDSMKESNSGGFYDWSGQALSF